MTHPLDDLAPVLANSVPEKRWNEWMVMLWSGTTLRATFQAFDQVDGA